jgi:hypothetical protein
MIWLRHDRLNCWYIQGHGRGVWGYRTPWGAWAGWRRLNRTLPGMPVISKLIGAALAGVVTAVILMLSYAPYWLGYATFPKGRP